MVSLCGKGGRIALAPFMCRCRTHHSSESFGKIRGLPNALCLILSSHTPLFWVVKVGMTCKVASGSSSVALVSNTRLLQLNTTSARKNGVLSELDPMFLPYHRMKNWAMQSQNSRSRVYSYTSATSESFQSTWRGIGFIHLGGW